MVKRPTRDETMSRFIRENTEVANLATVEEMFQMAEFCQVFLTARYIKNDDTSFIPLIERGRLERMPSEVVEEMDEMMTVAVKELEKWGNDPAAFMAKMENGDYDPVSDFIDTPEMKDALGNVIMRRLRISRGLHDPEEAFAEAKKLMPEVRDLMHAFVSANVLQAMDTLAREVTKKGVEFEGLSEKIEVMVSVVDDRGIGISAKLKPEAVAEADTKREKQKKDEKKSVEFDPAWG